jgi:DNA-binding transcriptional ArsR family regulator
MPWLDDAAFTSPGPRVTVRPSSPVELCWVLHAALREDFREGHPALRALFEEHPALLEQAAAFWQDGASPGLGFLELLVLAHQSDVLFDLDPGELFSNIDGPAFPSSTPLSLTSESEADRLVVVDRLARLRRTKRLRHDYATLLDAVWAAVGPTWERTGRRAVEAVCVDRREQLARGAAWPEIARSECDIGDLVSRLVAGLGPDGELCVVPAFFTHKGLVFDLPGLVVVGVRADPASPEGQFRTQLLARRLKTLADPTRLGIVDQLVSGPRTVTELARHFRVAQPTVSNHVKLLRDAGLVTDVRVGSRRQLALDPATVGELLDHLRAMLAPTADGAPTAGH